MNDCLHLETNCISLVRIGIPSRAHLVTSIEKRSVKMDEDKVVVFDANGGIRIYDPEKFDELVKTLNTQKDYILKMDEFKGIVAQTMGIVQQLGQAIEKEKLRAIGSRNVVESETEARKRALLEAQIRLREKQIELDRYIAEYSSLQKVEAEQKAIIQRLSLSSTD